MNPDTSTNTDAASSRPPTPERLLQIIAEHAGSDGSWEYSYAILADGAVSDPRRLEAALAELERRGRITIDRCRVRLA